MCAMRAKSGPFTALDWRHAYGEPGGAMPRGLASSLLEPAARKDGVHALEELSMIARPNLAHWRIGSALLAALLAVGQAAFGGLSGPTSAQAQACSPQIGIDAPSPGDTVSGTATFSGWAVDLSTPAGS